MQKIFQNRKTYRKDKTWGNKRNRNQKLLVNLNYQSRQNTFAKLSKLLIEFSSVSSVAQSCPTLCDPMDCSTLGLPVHHQLPEPSQTHVHGVSDAIQNISSSVVPFNLSQHQDLFQGVSSSHQVAKVSEFQLQHQSFQRTPRTDLP